jgi:hypothetical protein
LRWVTEGRKHVGGGGPDLRPGETKLPAAQARTGHARDAPGDTGRSHGREASDGLLWTIEHRLYRAGSTDCPPWSGSFGSSHLVHGEACPHLLAHLQWWRADSHVVRPHASLRVTLGRPAAARWQAGGATRPPTYRSSGSGENQPTVDSEGSAQFSLAAGATLHHVSVNGARRHPVKWR